jgi:hypothetical protein
MTTLVITAALVTAWYWLVTPLLTEIWTATERPAAAAAGDCDFAETA